MSLEVKIKDRIAKVEILEQHGSKYKVVIDDRTYELDVTNVETGVYSLIYKNQSTNMEMIEMDSPGKYIVNTRNNDYQVEVLDSRARYLAELTDELDGDNTIVSPMPGKIVRILVSEDDPVKKGDTVVVVSAMKMESEYKSPVDGLVKTISVSEGDTVEGNQTLVEIEAISE